MRHRQLKQLNEWEKIHGEFDKANYEEFTLKRLPSESTYYHGEIIKWALDIDPPPQRTLLPGEGKKAAKHIQDKIGINNTYTAGVLDVDYKWDFEETPPRMGQFDLIISQAILEHLLNPYKHIYDLVSLLVPGGSLIIHIPYTPDFTIIDILLIRAGFSRTGSRK